MFSSSVLLSPGRDAAALRMDPADVPASEIKSGASSVSSTVTSSFGFVPLCVIRGGGRCSLDPDSRRHSSGSISCFSGGVFSATCSSDSSPDFSQSIGEAFGNAGIKLQFPSPEFIVAMGFFSVSVSEQIVSAFRDRSSSQQEERRASMADPGIQADGHVHADSGSQSASRAFVSVFSSSSHSVFEGLAVGSSEDGREVSEVCSASSIHKSVVSFSSSVASSGGRSRRAAACGCSSTFAAMSPSGVASGVGLSETRTSPQHQSARSTSEGSAAGTFVYITFMEISPHESASGRGRIPKVAAMSSGFAVVTGVLFIKS